MKAIETRYAGCRFRSRLEARWAVFFDTLGVPWEYEPQGFDLPSGRYLPDFWLPSISSWYEVKGTKPTDDESKLAHDLADATGHRVLVAWGSIPWGTDEYGKPHDFDWNDRRHDIWLNGNNDYDYTWCVCTTCGKPGCEFDGRSARICRHDADDKTYTGDDPLVLAAYTAARSARFEFGESG